MEIITSEINTNIISTIKRLLLLIIQLIRKKAFRINVEKIKNLLAIVISKDVGIELSKFFNFFHHFINVFYNDTFIIRTNLIGLCTNIKTHNRQAHHDMFRNQITEGF